MASAKASVTTVAFLMLALAACAPGQSVPTPSPSPSASVDRVLADPPEPRLPGGCDDLLSAEEASAYVGPPVAPDPEEEPDLGDAPSSSPLGAARAQAGLIDCSWAGEAGDVNVVVLPEGASSYFALVDAWPEEFGTILTAPVGERDSSSCYDGWFHCEVNFVTHGYWVTIYQNVSRTEADAAALLTTLTQGVEQRVAALGEPRPAFVSTVTRQLGETCPAGLDPEGAVFAAAGVAGSGPEDDSSGDGLAIWYRAEADAGYLFCDWTGESGSSFWFWLHTTPGSSWAWPDVVAAHPDARSVTVAGASEAIGYCDSQCWIQALAGGSWIEASATSYPDRDLDFLVAVASAAFPLVERTFETP